MGHTTPTLYLLSAVSRAVMTSTTTRLRSLADRGGVFDAPTQKCPPDRGSSDWVRDSPARNSKAPIVTRDGIVFPPTPPPEDGAPSSPPFAHNINSNNNITVAVAHTLPQPIPIKSKQASFGNAYATPPLTPEDDPLSAPAPSAEENDALAFLTTLFPRHGASALPYAQKVSISAPEMGASFDGVVLDLPGDEGRTFYVDGSSAATVNLRESIVALLDLADEQLDCTALVIALDRSSSALGELLHSLMYVGGTVVTKPPFPTNSAFVLVGLEM